MISQKVLPNQDLSSLPAFLTPRDFAAFFRIHEKTVLRRIKGGHIPYKRFAHKIFIPRSFVFSLDYDTKKGDS